MSTRANVSREPDAWPPRPAGEVFPEIVTTVDVAMLLRYDGRPGVTPEKGARMVRLLARDYQLPTLGRVGRTLLLRKADVLAWVAGRGVAAAAGGAADFVSEDRSVSSGGTTAS